jgi:uncharacterized protein YdiU (UPF0061 family)
MEFSNTYLNLGERFYQKTKPTPVVSPQLVLWNERLAEHLKVSPELQSDRKALAQVFSGNRLLDGSEPIAAAYAGHQFGNFNPRLGDGRAHLLGELIDRSDQRRDLQLKGSGPSAFSRSGDGRCTLGAAVREFIMSEAMFALGVPTTQCLAVVTTGETVYRQRPYPGAVVTRVASSHIRVGNFQYFAAHGDKESLQALCDYTIARHYPELKNVDQPYIALIDKVMGKQISLIIQWMRVGFIHGVMNTDNTSISGETIDFGPCAMMGAYNPSTVYSSIDHAGRYAFGNQANMAYWNMARFAECMLFLLDQEDKNIMKQIEDLIAHYPKRYQDAYLKMMSAKFGLMTAKPGDEQLIAGWLEAMSTRELDYTNTFDLLTRSLGSGSRLANTETNEGEAIDQELTATLGPHYDRWKHRISEELEGTDQTRELVGQWMRQHNPVVIPRNHLTENVISECEERSDFSAAEDFLRMLRDPYNEQIPQAYRKPPEHGDKHYQTFCGT